MNLGVPREIATPILISPESMSASTPVVEKFITKPNIILNPKTASSGYVAPPMIHSTPIPVNSNGYVTHSMLNVSVKNINI